MSGNASLSEPALPDEPAVRLPASVRVAAELRLGVARIDGQSRLTDRHEAGAFRFRFPRAHGRAPEAVLVNVAGGLAGGDCVSIDLHCGRDAELTLSSATAERIYRSDGAATLLTNRLRVAEGGRLCWLPQETILFEGSALRRSVTVELAATAQAIIGEMMVFGRIAAGEILTESALHDRWRIRRAGKLVLAEDLRFGAGRPGDLRLPIALGRATAMATLVLALPEPEGLLDALRNLPEPAGLEQGSTLVDGLVILRLASEDAAILRQHALALARFALDRTAMPFPRAFTNE